MGGAPLRGRDAAGKESAEVATHVRCVRRPHSRNAAGDWVDRGSGSVPSGSLSSAGALVPRAANVCSERRGCTGWDPASPCRCRSVHRRTAA